MKKKFAIAATALLLGGTLTAYASNDFTFCFSSNVIGKTEYKLKKKETKCESKAITCRYYTGESVSFVGNYRIDLDGNGFFAADYKGKYKKADGSSCITKYGKIDKNTYTVNIGTNSDLIPKGGQIEGSGEILQE